MYRRVSTNKYASAATMLAAANSSILIVDNTDRQRLINQALNPSYYPINPNSDSDILHKSYIQQEQYVAQDVADRNDRQEHGGGPDSPPPSPPNRPGNSRQAPPPSTPSSRRSQPPPPSTPQGREQDHHQIRAQRSDPSAPRDQQSMMQSAARPATYVNGRRVRSPEERQEIDRGLEENLDHFRRESQRNHEHDLQNPLDARLRALSGLSRTAYETRRSRFESDHLLAHGRIANTSGVNAISLLASATEAGRAVEAQHQSFDRHDLTRQDLLSRTDVQMRERADHLGDMAGSLLSNRHAMDRDLNLGASQIHANNNHIAGITHRPRPSTDMGAGPSNVRGSTREYHAVVPYTGPPSATQAALNTAVYPIPAGLSSSLAHVLAPAALVPIVRSRERIEPREYRAVRGDGEKSLEPDNPSREDRDLPILRSTRRRVSMPPAVLPAVNRNQSLILFGQNDRHPYNRH